MSNLIYGHEFSFDEKAHAYTWDGKFVPGVTSVLQTLGKPALVGWAANMASDHFLGAVTSGRTDYPTIHKESKSAHRKKAQKAASIGHNVHAYAECVFKNQPLPTLETDQAKKGVEAFHKWLDAHKVKVVSSERRIFSLTHFYAGTCDFVAEVDGVLGVGDIKTSSGIYPEMRFQTAAYQHAIEEQDNMKFGVRWIVRFDKITGNFEAKSFYNFELDFTGFLAALNIYKTLKQIEKE